MPGKIVELRRKPMKPALSIANIMQPITAQPYKDPDAGDPFDLIEDGPGVIALFANDGSALCIEECDKSMRSVIGDHHKGYRGSQYGIALALGWEATSQPAARRLELENEHNEKFGRLSGVATQL